MTTNLSTPAGTPKPSENLANGQDGSSLNPEQELVARLKTAIDQNGRYAYRLHDMASGYAAAKDISTNEARFQIEETFANHIGSTPHEYLEKHFHENRQARGATKSRGR